MSKLKKPEEKQDLCHFCRRSKKTDFLYDLHHGIHNSRRSKIPVCGTHFNELCNMTYTKDDEQTYLSDGQKEYVSVRRLESKLDVSNTIHSK